MSQNAKYYGKLFFGAIIAGIVLSNWTGSNAILGTGFKGLGGLATSLKANPAASSQRAA